MKVRFASTLGERSFTASYSGRRRRNELLFIHMHLAGGHVAFHSAVRLSAAAARYQAAQTGAFGRAVRIHNCIEREHMSHTALPNPPVTSSTTAASSPHTTEARKRERSIPALAEISKLVTYSAALAGIYLSVGFLFYFAMKEKLFTDSGTMPAPLAKAFDGSFFASVPGNNASWTLLGLLELSIVVLLAVSLVSGEFLPQRRKPILLAGLSVSLFAYGFMGLANDMIGNNATVIELFTYFGITIAAMFLIRQGKPTTHNSHADA
jgi:hypothetical protein